MSRDPNREFDKTCLKIFLYDGVHRDYGAHFFRWGFIGSKVIKKDDRVLDIGCGVQAPLARMIANTEESLSLIPSKYIGVDMNRQPKDTFKSPWAEFHYGFNFARDWKKLGEEFGQFNFDVITCLEVVEHMTMPNVLKLLRGARVLANPAGRLVLSTPVFNGKAAKNHINEMTIPVLQKALEKCGWVVEKRFGTFASWNDVKKVASPEHLAAAGRLREYYSGAVVACFLAPMYPDAARNNVWICRPNVGGVEDLL